MLSIGPSSRCLNRSVEFLGTGVVHPWTTRNAPKGVLMEKRVLPAFVGVSLVGAASMASAAVPEGVQAIFTGAATDFGTLAGYGAVAMAAITGGLLVLKLVKKVINRTT